MDLFKKISVVLLLPAVFLYLGWLMVTALKSGQAYFPHIGYYSRKLRPKSYWALIVLQIVVAMAFVIGWFFLIKEYIDNNWQ
jgi:uncharacterized membrane protein YphA (DoxX/SURF4 family)